MKFKDQEKKEFVSIIIGKKTPGKGTFQKGTKTIPPIYDTNVNEVYEFILEKLKEGTK